MTEKLTLTLHGDSRARGGKVVAYLHPLGGGEDLQVPAEIGGPTTVDVSRGQYLIDVALPSGERIRKLADVGGPTVVNLVPPRSPHEWLAFHSLLVPRQRLEPQRRVEGVLREPPSAPRVYLLGEWPETWRGVKLAQSVDDKVLLTVAAEQAVRPSSNDDVVYRFELRLGDVARGQIGVARDQRRASKCFCNHRRSSFRAGSRLSG